MRWMLGLLFFLALSVLGGYVFLKGYPYKLYSNWVEGRDWNRYYKISNYRESLLKPVTLEEIPPYQEDYPQLWKEFPLRNSLMPLPTRHPLFQTIPIVDLKSKESAPTLGMRILAASGREISRVYTLPNSLYQDHSLGQELFKLPFVRNRIIKKDVDTLWRDIFSYEIDVKSKDLDTMIYDLYILHLRSKVLPKETLRYGLIKDGKKAVIELLSNNKDYLMEIVMTQSNGTIYSYILRTERRSEESKKLRAKYLESISFSPIDPAMGRLLYTEFKQLNFARQVDQEGLLYLFCAWSQDPKSIEMLKEMIFYLERGKKNTEHLKVLYSYAFKKYGKTFTTRTLFTDHSDPEVVLQRKIEIENLEKKQALEREDKKAPETALTPDEKMNMYLKKAKETEAPEAKEMTIH